MTETRIAVITGAASGIGRGLARVAAEKGFRVYLVDVDRTMLETAVRDIARDTALRVVDVRDHVAVERLAAELFEREGRVDLLVNNAGILRGGLSWEIAEEDWRKTLDVNIMGVVNGLRSFVGRMTATGLPAHVANTASIAGFVTAPLLTPYAASKFAVVALTEALSVELQIQGSAVRAHVIAPGPVRTSIYASASRHEGPGSEDAVVQMRTFTEQAGIDPTDFARFVFRGIENDEFWIVSHPELWEADLKARTERILARENPAPSHHSFDPRT